MHKRFQEMLVQYAHEPNAEERQLLEASLWREYGVVKAVLVLDLSGFSQLTQKYGIVHYLSMVRRMQLVSEPIVRESGGEIIKFEADNLFAMFDQPEQAVRAAIALNAAFFEINVYTEEQFDIRVSIGIDFGEILLVGGRDFFGAPVIRASKLGEEVAGPGEILITESAMAALPDAAAVKGESLHLTLSGIEVDAYSIRC